MTAPQKEKFEEIRAGMKQSIDSGRDEGRDFFNELKTEMNKDDPDMKMVASLSRPN